MVAKPPVHSYRYHQCDGLYGNGDQYRKWRFRRGRLWHWVQGRQRQYSKRYRVGNRCVVSERLSHTNGG